MRSCKYRIRILSDPQSPKIVKENKLECLFLVKIRKAAVYQTLKAFLLLPIGVTPVK